MYISQDPIRLRGGDNLYGYVYDPNCHVDLLGLASAKVATLTLADGTVYTAKSGEPGGRTHPDLTSNENYDATVRTAKDNASRIPGNEDVTYFGSCAEINVINAAILSGETRESLQGATMDTRFNKNRKENEYRKEAKKGDPAEACDCCAQVLEELGITDVNEGCGNK